MHSTLLRNIYANETASEDTIRTSGLDWTLVDPTALTDGPAKDVHRADVADLMHKAAHRGEWIHRDAVITD